ncbi:sulfotransferase [Sphingomonas sp. A2-49]|uniref:tetratricopeptide repeat-containing sulfotransferase family protein n=1 Tax=Sphingomonas sp. A2-49 TaxID=1391375 RepID=UPI0021D19C72|nr:sulfotransferase [Sphingomonas sp. A2-49]MCU6453902.1 sulfotransferase [Sphingomonas sp. A2-49]
MNGKRRNDGDHARLSSAAQAAAKRGLIEEAERLYREALVTMPDDVFARHGLAISLYRQARASEALQEIIRLRTRDSTRSDFIGLEAAIRAATGDHHASLDLYRALAATGRISARQSLGMAQQLKTLGQFAAATSLLRSMIASDSTGDVALRAETWWTLADLKTGALTAGDRQIVAALLASPDSRGDARVHLHYALGQALDCCEEPDAAFDHFRSGADLLRRRSRYRAQDTTDRVETTMKALSRMTFAQRPPAPQLQATPIFVVGLPRAGSTLVEQILASHPAVEATMELVELPLLARSIGLEPPDCHPERLALLTTTQLRRLGEQYIERTRIYRKTARTIFVDKMPNNWFHAGLILAALPHARIVDVRRAPLATGVSAFKQLFARGQAFSYDLADLGRYYRDYVRLMRHVDTVAPGRVHRLVYEDLLDDPEGTIRALLEACDLPFADACLDFQATVRPVWTPSAAQVRRPLYADAREAWRAVDAHLEPMCAALGATLTDWR